MAKQQSTHPPPYGSFGTFKSTTDTLAESIVPSGPLDRRVLDNLSGADYGSLMPGLRFLGLVDEERIATASYRSLVQAVKDREKFNTALLEIVTNKYKPITGSVDVKNGTITELEKAFKDAGVSPGQMLTKTIRFYVKALQEGGIKVSPHITKDGRKGNGAKKSDTTRKKTKAAKALPAMPGERRREEAPDVLMKGYERLPIPGLVGAYIQYPAQLTAANCDLFEAMVGVLRAYVRGQSGGNEKKP